MISDLDYNLILDISMSSIFILLRVEVNLFVLSPEIEDRDEVEVGNWAKHKESTMIYVYTILSSSRSQKKNRT
jgi:hypothetical protein